MSKLVSIRRMLSSAALALVCVTPAVAQQMSFINIVTGEPLDLQSGRQEGRDTPAVGQFMQTGKNPYNEHKAALVKGKDIFNTSCSGCHGHLGEGKIGPALNRGNWNYELEEDKTLFEVIFGGATRQMGPQNEFLTQDEILHVMAWVRHLYTGKAQDATWLTEEQQKHFKPYQE